MKKLIEYLIGDILYLISFLIPKSKKIWVFGSWGGKAFADNPKYLFTYIQSQDGPIKTIWVSRSKVVVATLRANGYRSFLVNSIPGIWYSCRAKIGVTSHGMIDLNRFACARMKIVQTWHGIPMKPILLSDPKEKTIKKRKKLLKLSHFFPFLKTELHFHKNLVVCSTSELVNNIFKECFGNDAPIEKTGYPRNDGMFLLPKNSTFIQKVNNLKEEGYKVGIYMPTYRLEGEFDIVKYFVKNIDIIDKELKKLKQVFFLKIHPFEYYKIPKEFKSDNIIFINNDEIGGDIYSILGVFDFLISDFSSIIFDYFILERPVFLVVPDRESYIKSNGRLVFDYKKIGIPVANDWEELFTNLGKYQRGVYEANIKSIADSFHDNKDGNSSQRLYENIMLKIGL